MQNQIQSVLGYTKINLILQPSEKVLGVGYCTLLRHLSEIKTFFLKNVVNYLINLQFTLFGCSMTPIFHLIFVDQILSRFYPPSQKKPGKTLSMRSYK